MYFVFEYRMMSKAKKVFDKILRKFQEAQELDSKSLPLPQQLKRYTVKYWERQQRKYTFTETFDNLDMMLKFIKELENCGNVVIHNMTVKSCWKWTLSFFRRSGITRKIYKQVLNKVRSCTEDDTKENNSEWSQIGNTSKCGI